MYVKLGWLHCVVHEWLTSEEQEKRRYAAAQTKEVTKDDSSVFQASNRVAARTHRVVLLMFRRSASMHLPARAPPLPSRRA